MTRRGGFTLLEIMIVVLITGMMASIALPRLSFYVEPRVAVLQRMMEEAGEMALSGTTVRLSIKEEGSTRHGPIVAEGYLKRELPEDSLSVFLGTAGNKPEVLEWREIELKNMPDGENWRFDPEVIYFFTDGSCTPARITYTQDVYGSEEEHYILTVTGYCMELASRN